MARWLWFGAWVLIGAAAAFGVIASGGLLLIPVAPVVALMLRRPEIRRSAFGALSGAGFFLLAVAYLHRDGPGTTCNRLPLGGMRCDEHPNPIPWLVLGILLVVAGVVGDVRATRRSA